MKHTFLILFFATIIVFQPGCKSVVDDIIDCSIESLFLSIHADIDSTNSKLVHFEFVNKDTEDDFILDSDINWDFGDGSTTTSTNHKTNHLYSNSGDYIVIATYVLRRGGATCNGPKEKNITIE